MFYKYQRLFCLLTVLIFCAVSLPAYPIISDLPSPGTLVMPRGTASLPVLKGLKLDAQNPMHIQFIIEPGNNGVVNKDDANKLIRYFFAALATPDKDLWVNLSPYEQSRIIDNNLSRTELGQAMLEQDYILKQISASLTHPQTPAGKSYWNDLSKAENSLNKVWISADNAQVYEGDNTVVITKATLKALTDADGRQATAFKRNILSTLETELNQGEYFANLRQIYNAVILSYWFKKKFKESFFNGYIDKQKINGIDKASVGSKDKIYQMYLEAFQKGAYDYIARTQEQTGRKIVKSRYFSGGILPAMGLNSTGVSVTVDSAAADVSPQAVIGDVTVGKASFPLDDASIAALKESSKLPVAAESTLSIPAKVRLANLKREFHGKRDYSRMLALVGSGLSLSSALAVAALHMYDATAYGPDGVDFLRDLRLPIFAASILAGIPLGMYVKGGRNSRIDALDEIGGYGVDGVRVFLKEVTDISDRSIGGWYGHNNKIINYIAGAPVRADLREEYIRIINMGRNKQMPMVQPLIYYCAHALYSLGDSSYLIDFILTQPKYTNGLSMDEALAVLYANDVSAQDILLYACCRDYTSPQTKKVIEWALGQMSEERFIDTICQAIDYVNTDNLAGVFGVLRLDGLSEAAIVRIMDLLYSKAKKSFREDYGRWGIGLLRILKPVMTDQDKAGVVQWALNDMRGNTDERFDLMVYFGAAKEDLLKFVQGNLGRMKAGLWHQVLEGRYTVDQIVDGVLERPLSQSDLRVINTIAPHRTPEAIKTYLDTVVISKDELIKLADDFAAYRQDFLPYLSKAALSLPVKEETPSRSTVDTRRDVLFHLAGLVSVGELCTSIGDKMITAEPALKQAAIDFVVSELPADIAVWGLLRRLDASPEKLVAYLGRFSADRLSPQLYQLRAALFALAANNPGVWYEYLANKVTLGFLDGIKEAVPSALLRKEREEELELLRAHVSLYYKRSPHDFSEYTTQERINITESVNDFDIRWYDYFMEQAGEYPGIETTNHGKKSVEEPYIVNWTVVGTHTVEVDDIRETPVTKYRNEHMKKAADALLGKVVAIVRRVGELKELLFSSGHDFSTQELRDLHRLASRIYDCKDGQLDIAGLNLPNIERISAILPEGRNGLFSSYTVSTQDPAAALKELFDKFSVSQVSEIDAARQSVVNVLTARMEQNDGGIAWRSIAVVGSGKSGNFYFTCMPEIGDVNGVDFTLNWLGKAAI